MEGLSSSLNMQAVILFNLTISRAENKIAAYGINLLNKVLQKISL